MQVVNSIVLGFVALAIAVDFYKDIKKAVEDHESSTTNEE